MGDWDDGPALGALLAQQKPKPAPKPLLRRPQPSSASEVDAGGKSGVGVKRMREESLAAVGRPRSAAEGREVARGKRRADHDTGDGADGAATQRVRDPGGFFTAVASSSRSAAFSMSDARDKRGSGRGDRRSREADASEDEDEEDEVGFRAVRDASDEDDDDEHDDGHSDAEGDGRKKRRRKHAPTEAPANKPVGRFREVVAVAHSRTRDPRFDSTSGDYKEDLFRSNYKFLGEYKEGEIAALKSELASSACRDPARRAEVQALLTKLQQQRAEELQKEHSSAVLRKLKKEEAAKVAAGKTPFFMKKSDVKRVVATERFRNLEAKGGAAVEKALKKRRKKLLGKERKAEAMPTERRGIEGTGSSNTSYGGGGGGGGSGRGYSGGGGGSGFGSRGSSAGPARGGAGGPPPRRER